ncbi:MAG: hypothetical protein ACLPOA_04645, partial [Methylocella sp.]
MAIDVRTKKRLRFALAAGIGRQDPTDLGWRQTAGVPERDAGDVVQHAALSAVPFGHGHSGPDG